MTWTYEEYAGYPYLADFFEKKFKFGIEFMEDIVSMDIKEGNEGTLLDIKTNGVLRPVFYMRLSGENSPLVYNLRFELKQGLVKEIWKEVEVTDLPNYRGFKRSVPELATYNDYMSIAKYAVNRFPILLWI
ncbi:MAG: hypothetical protein AABW51_00020 [Nanoarchaeota archaeon]